ncbi:MAG TPA: FtsX-like permease family protein [Chitinophagaceae bacterium]|jgi:putative ABC transport system permease protein|nr:FtsX-like permease family protein [Chitinophagaceae bacterium]
MLRSYFKTAWRNLLRNKVFSIIKILGLSIGLTVCMLIFLYTKDEISYDRFHKNKGQLYRVIQTVQFGDNDPQTIGITNGVMGETFAREIPEVQQCIRINGASVTVKKNNDVFVEQSMLVDDNFFSMFSFPLLAGNKKTALQDFHSVILSEDMVGKYFGANSDSYADIIGEIIQLKKNDEFENFTVTAIAKNSPQNSTIKGDMFFRIKTESRGQEWLGGNLNTFLLLSPQADIKIVEGKMQTMFDKNTKDFLAKAEKEQGISFKGKLSLQPLLDIHLSKKAGPDNGMTGGSRSVYSYILTCIAIFILIIACINFINLAVAQSLKRSKEIGIRKVVGGTRRQLIRQFLAESFLVSLIAFLIGILLTGILLPFFNELANKKLNLSYLSDGYLYAGYFLLLLITAFIAGFYPSLVLSAFQPVKVLYNRQKMMSKNFLTKGLIVLQFSLAIFLIIGTIAVNYQLKYLLHKDLGYDSKNLVRINLPSSEKSDNLPALFKNGLANERNILGVAARNGGRNTSGAKANGKNLVIENNKIDDKFLPIFKIPIVAGRNFLPDYSSDSTNSVIVNETFVREAGWKVSNAVGQTINFMDENKRPATVIGVVKDYHFGSLKKKITSELFSMNPNMSYGQVWIKISPNDIPETLAKLETVYKKLVPLFPYSYQFMDEVNANNYQAEAKWKQIISIASGLFIFISCIGLLGLVIISIEQRTKEIGIRKVLGAAITRIIFLISKEFIILISIAFIVAAPVGYYFTNKWLQEFAYRINIGWWMFGLAGLLVITIAMLTMGFQAIKAAIANPAKSLRTE